MSRESVLKRKSFDFGVRIINLYKYLKKQRNAYEIASQVVRSGTSVGALIREAEYAISRKDFLYKLTISLKEINESIYWLDLLFFTEFITKKMFESLKRDAEELLKMLIASIKTIKLKNTSTL